MRTTIEEKAKRGIPSWKRKDDRLSKLALWDMYLDNEIYDYLPYDYWKDARHGCDISIEKRKPAVRFNLARLISLQSARKLFAGRHAPHLENKPHPDVVPKVQDLINSCDLPTQMISVVFRGSVGSVVVPFRFVKSDDDDELVLVTDVERSSDCIPTFDAAKQLVQLRILKWMPGRWFLDHGVTHDYKGEVVKPDKRYWHIKDLTKLAEIHYLPLLTVDWKPYGEEIEKLIPITDGVLAIHEHKLKTVPAQWFVNQAVGEFPDGDCLFDPALDNCVAYDYKMSQLWFGLMKGSCPITVMQGNFKRFTDDEGNPLEVSPSAILHFESTLKEGETTEGGGDAHYLESNGQGWAQSLAFCRQLKKDAHEQIAASRRDPDKVTTSASGKAMDTVDEDVTDLVMELRTCFGENGFLRLVKKIARAAIAVDHPLMQGVTVEQIKSLGLIWPDIHEMTPQDQQLFTAGIAQAQEAGVLSQEDAHEIYTGKMDINKSSTKLPKKQAPASGQSKENKK